MHSPLPPQMAIISTYGWDRRKAMERCGLCSLRKWYHHRREVISLDSPSREAFNTAFMQKYTPFSIAFSKTLFLATISLHDLAATLRMNSPRSQLKLIWRPTQKCRSERLPITPQESSGIVTEDLRGKTIPHAAPGTNH